MKKRALVFSVSMAILLLVLPIFSSCSNNGGVKAGGEKVLYIGGTFSLTGAYAEDCTAVLAAFEDYVKYVNETKHLAPWLEQTLPEDVKLEVVWKDDELKIDKTLSIHDELLSKGMLVARVSGSPQALALMQTLNKEGIAATSQATGSYLLTPPMTVFTYYPIYTDDLAAIADWFMDNWKENRKPRVAYLTADNSFGRSIVIKQMDDYLTKLGFDLVGVQYVPLVPAAPPTTQLMWLKTEKVDLAIGCMVNPGSQPTIKEANRLGMGPDLDYKITFGFAGPSHLADFAPDMGQQGNGVVVGGSFPTFDDLAVEGIRFCNELIDKYHSGVKNMHIMYVAGVLEAMIQTEALRLTMEKVPFEELTPKDVLEYGFYQIKGLETGGLSSTPITYGPGDVEGVDMVRLDIAENGKVKYLGSYSCQHIINPLDAGGY